VVEDNEFEFVVTLWRKSEVAGILSFSGRYRILSDLVCFLFNLWSGLTMPLLPH